MLKKASNTPRSSVKGNGFTLGRQAFASISAVEGIALCSAAKKRIRESDRAGLTPDQRRQEIIRAYRAKA